MKAISLIIFMSVLPLYAMASVDCTQGASITKTDATQLLSRSDYESIALGGVLPKAGVYYRYLWLIRDTYSSDIWYDSERNILKNSVLSMDSKNGDPKLKQKIKKLTKAQREQYFCLIRNAWEAKIPSKSFEEKNEEIKKSCVTKKNNEDIHQKISSESFRVFKNCQLSLGDKNKLCEKIVGTDFTSPTIDFVPDVNECDFEAFPSIVLRSSYHSFQELILVDGNDFKVFQYDDADSPEAKELQTFLYNISK